MTKKKWPPKVYNIHVEYLNDKTISHPAFRFYCKLRALAWGNDTLKIRLGELMTAVQLQRSAVFEYARSLQLHNALLWHCAGDVFECSFPGVTKEDSESGDPPLAEIANIDPPPSTTPSLQTNLEVKDESAKSAGSGSTDSRRKAATSEIQAAYVELVGREIEWAAGESKAAKAIGARYSVAEFVEAYAHYKRQDFWRDKRLTLRYLNTQIDEYFTAKRNGRLRSVERTAVEHRQPQPGNSVSDEGLAFIERLSRNTDPGPK